jgi:hypothetical protein
METMSKFKVGDKIVVNARNSTLNKVVKIGDVRIVTDTQSTGVELDFIPDGWVHDVDIELVPKIIKPKWTIYNNDKAWQDLSDKQKGKMLLAAHNGSSFGGTDKTEFNNPDYAYKAKPEPTMAEKFIADAGDWDFKSSNDFSGYMIAKGWNKPCK